MKRSIVCICIIIIITSCVINNSDKPAQDNTDTSPPTDTNPSIDTSLSTDKTDGITIFITGNILGSLKPCGCSGGQLGGLERRPVVFNSVPTQRRLIIDTGSIVETDGEQDLIKFSIIMQAFNMLEYDIVNLTREDIEIAQNVGMIGDSLVNFISAFVEDEEIGDGYQNEFLLNGENIIVTVITLDLETRPIEFIREAFPQEEGKKM